MGFDVLVFAEQREGAFKRSAFECLTLARQLAGGGKVHAALLGDGVASLAGDLFAAGADTVHVVEDPSYRRYHPTGYPAALKAALDASGASLVLLPATAMGRDLAPRFAARIGRPWIAEAIEVAATADGRVRARKSVYGGKLFANQETKGQPPYVVTVRPGAVTAAP
ncbi:MAG: electron transfer flavoprotein subunit alpha/FixB family protein, partial [Candidatus Eisenbacteria bacterium]|nr:electron transfer flavoprotein subunit alpha/FixB family protein [Candidatus Eisenbacteria bacterium]